MNSKQSPSTNNKTIAWPAVRGFRDACFIQMDHPSLRDWQIAQRDTSTTCFFLFGFYMSTTRRRSLTLQKEADQNKNQGSQWNGEVMPVNNPWRAPDDCVQGNDVNGPPRVSTEPTGRVGGTLLRVQYVPVRTSLANPVTYCQEACFTGDRSHGRLPRLTAVLRNLRGVPSLLLLLLSLLGR